MLLASRHRSLSIDPLCSSLLCDTAHAPQHSPSRPSAATPIHSCLQSGKCKVLNSILGTKIKSKISSQNLRPPQVSLMPPPVSLTSAARSDCSERSSLGSAGHLYTWACDCSPGRQCVGGLWSPHPWLTGLSHSCGPCLHLLPPAVTC